MAVGMRLMGKPVVAKRGLIEPSKGPLLCDFHAHCAEMTPLKGGNRWAFKST